MKISKLVFCVIMAALLTVLNAQQADDFNAEEMTQPALRGPMGGQMGLQMGPGQFGGHREMGKKMRPQKGWDVPEDMEVKIMEVIKRNDPSLAERLTKLKEYNEKKYKATLAIAARFLETARMSDDASFEKDVVTGIGLEYDVRELSISYAKASDSQKAQIKEQIKSKLNELFDIRTKGHQLRVKKLESEITKLKKGIETRKANKSKIVEQRLEQLIGDKYLSW